uniref:Uncharacterized protein n=1 Tax=Romanomermis culicivorax TaxID=13658 RepID=A0A915KC86_ROMCU
MLGSERGHFCWSLVGMVTPTLALANDAIAAPQPRKPFNTGLMIQPIHGFRTRPFSLSPGQDGHTYPDIDRWWDISGATQEALQQAPPKKPFNTGILLNLRLPVSKIVINELNIRNPEKPEEFEFIELKLVHSSGNKSFSAKPIV